MDREHLSERNTKSALNRRGEVTRQQLFDLATTIRGYATSLETAGVKLTIRRGSSVKIDGAKKAELALGYLHRYLARPSIIADLRGKLKPETEKGAAFGSLSCTFLPIFYRSQTPFALKRNMEDFSAFTSARSSYSRTRVDPPTWCSSTYSAVRLAVLNSFASPVPPIL